MWEKLQRIYNSLSDEESKFIFRKRLSYNLNNEDTEALYEMGTMKEDNDEHSIYTLVKNRSSYPENQEIILFGAGRWGGFHRKMYEDYKLGKIVAYCDNNKELWGSFKNGIPVISVEDACEKYKKAVFVLESVFFWKQMKEQLLNLGVSQDRIFSYLYSTHIFGVQYLDEKFMDLVSEEGVFIDAGCLDLGDTRGYINRNPNYKKVYAFEPDYKNYERCLDRKQKYCCDDERIEIVNKGLWSCETELRFNENAASSVITEKGTASIQVISLDQFMENREKATFIKMDIEGAEMEALHGASKIIKRDKPDLAICIYHKNEDILDIPNYILDLNPDYKLYIRHYSCYKWETVLYAVM